MKKLGLWLTSVLAVCLMLFGCVSCAGKGSTSEGGQPEAKALKLSETAYTLEVGETLTLTATPETAAVTWSTSDEAVATVEDGVVTALVAGSATITAEASGYEKATCEITVVEAPEYVELTVDKEVLELREGGASVLVTATFTVNDEAHDCTFVWTSENDEIATVENGSITPVGVGSTVVTVSVEYKEETYSADVNVAVKPDENIQVSKGTIALALAEINGDIISDTFTATAYKSGVENTDVTLAFVSSNEDVATVTAEGGVATVTAKGEGTCKISVSYDSAYGKIETLVHVTVARSTLVFDEMIEIAYVQDNTVLDFSAVELLGEVDGVYFDGKQVAAADGVLDTAFVEQNKGVIVPIEVRTSVAIYEAELLIAVPYVADPKQEVVANELVDMPEYGGDAVALGFPEGTETAYEIEVDNDTDGKGSWDDRMIINVATDKDVLVFDIIIKEAASSDAALYVWPAKNTLETQGVYTVTAKNSAPAFGADVDRKVFVLGTDGKRPATLATGTLYTVYFFLNKGESHAHFNMQTNGIIHVANIRCIDADEVENDPTLPPPPISQGEDRNPMPVYGGDVTALGFAEGTTVYEVVGPQGNANDVKLVAQVDSTGDKAYVKMDFVPSAATASLGLWITAKNSHLGYYTVTPEGFTTDGLGDPSRTIFVTDANGASVTAFEANKVYTLYIGLDGREATVQLTTWAGLTLYIANITCISESEVDELPFEDPRPSVDPGEEISILFIGNSFSDDTEAYMVDILLNLGYTNINIGNLYIGGCSIDMHYENIMNDASAYDFRMRSHNGRKYTEYETVTVGGTQKSIAFAIAYKDWDIISVQQASGYSGKADSYNNLNALVDEVKKQATNPEVEIVFNMTWAYQSNSTHAQFPDYNSDQMTMYTGIVNAVQTKVDYTVVPNGTAIQNARTSFIGDNLTRDGYHLDLKIGRFIAGLTFVAKVTGKDITALTYVPNGVTKAQFEVALESIQNALNDPYNVTESQIKKDPYAIDPNSPITAGGSNTDAVSIYNGNVEDLGFAAGSEVFKYVGVDSASDKVAIKVDSTNYDYVDVQFVIASGDGYFFMHGLKGGNWHNNGASYVIDPSWIRLGDGTNNPSDRTIQIFDADGNKVTSLMSNNVLYTLRVFTKVGELDEIRISKSGSTIYLANVTQGLEADLPQPVPEGPIKQGDGATALPTYTDDVTAHGFAESAFVQYMVTETSTNVWGADPISGKTREQLAAKIIGEAGKYVTVQFAVSEDVAGDSVFYVWGLLGAQHTINGAVNFTSTTHGRILDLDGNKVTSLTKDTLYVLELYMEGTDTYKVANIVATGMELYFDANSITCSDSSMEVIPEPDPDEPDPEPDTSAPIVSGETTSTALSKYDGDVTALGFAEGTTVYQLVSADSWNDRVRIAADPTYKYLDVQFIVSEGAWYFNVWLVNANGMLDGSYLVAENSGDGKQHATYGSGYAVYSGTNAGNTRIQVLDADGNVVIGGRNLGTVYTLRVWLAEENITEVQIGQSNMTMYFGNIESTNKEPAKLIKQGDGTTVLPTYTGDVTAHGFAESAFVQYMVTETSTNVWGADPISGKTREQLAARIPGEAGKYVTIQFATSEDIASGSVFYVWGLLGSTYTQQGGLNFTTTTYGRILDLNGYPVTSITKDTIYVLELYMEGTDMYKVSNLVATGMELYFATDSITYSDTSFAVQLPDADSPIQAGGTNKNAVTVYQGDETALGFAEGSTVYQYVGETSNDKISIKVDYVNYDYVDVQMVFDAASTKTWFLGFVMSGSTYLNGADAYILSGDSIRFNANASNPLDREIKFLDADGNVVTSALETGVLYTLRVYIKAGNVTEIQMRQIGVTVYLANVAQGVEEVIPDPVDPVAVEIKIGDDKADPTLFDGEETTYGFAEGTEVVVVALEATTDVDDKRLAMEVDSSKQYLAIDFALEFGLLGNIYVWTVTDGGERVLAATILAEGGVDAGALVDVAIKDSAGNDVTNEVLVGLDSGAAEKYTLYVYYNGANEVHIGCDDFDEEMGGNILYFANAECNNDET
ncbi:MAG: DUF4886 domain-containing protein [Clostridia bacterium]|nr:DUF4886 domain-containing protein [Clostridia bacterium]